MATLATYLSSTRRLLHDSLGRFWSTPDLTAYINQARRRTVGDTSCLRINQQIYISQGIEFYRLGGFTGANVTAGGAGYTSAPTVILTSADGNGTGAVATATIASGAVVSIQATNIGSGYTAAPLITFSGGGGTGAAATGSILDPNTLDVLNITVLWGQLRIILDRMSFTEFQSKIRAWQGYSQRPSVCSSYGQDGWFLGPIPDQFYFSEWDTVDTPIDLVNASDVCPIGPQYQEPVAFYAAHLAKFQEKSMTDATTFLEWYTRKKNYAVASVMKRKLPSAYGS